jgi:hypothetical protein
VSSITRSSKSKFIITQINENQFLVEGIANHTRLGGENEHAISYVDFDGGPMVHIGRDFLGRGRVVGIEIIDTDNPDYLITKITLNAETK